MNTKEPWMSQWNPTTAYFDTASYGLPPRPTTEVMQSVVRQWSEGSGIWEEWSKSTDRSREIFSSLLGVSSSSVMTGASLSQIVSLVSTAIPSSGEILSTDMEFTSNLFPYMALEDGDRSVRCVPTKALADSIHANTSVVACPHVQSASGEVVDLDGIRERCEEVGALLIVDATQSAGWLPADLRGVDAYICSGYKWLMCPRGVAFGVLSERIASKMSPLAANWFGGDNPHSSYYGPPLRLSQSARRFDISPAWFSWVGAESSLGVISDIGIEAIHEHNLTVTKAFCEAADLQADGRSAIISVATKDTFDTTRLPFRTSQRDGGLRLSFHLYNAIDEARSAGEMLKDHLRR